MSLAYMESETASRASESEVVKVKRLKVITEER